MKGMLLVCNNSLPPPIWTVGVFQFQVAFSDSGCRLQYPCSRWGGRHPIWKLTHIHWRWKKSKPVHTQSRRVSAYKLWWRSLAPLMIISSDEIDPIWVLMMAHHVVVIDPVISSLHTHYKAKTDWNRLWIALMAASAKVCKERDWREFKLLWKNVRGKVFVICSWLVSAAQVTTKEGASCCWWTNSPALWRASQ